jgi:hypothetical protein
MGRNNTYPVNPDPQQGHIMYVRTVPAGPNRQGTRSGRLRQEPGRPPPSTPPTGAGPATGGRGGRGGRPAGWTPPARCSSTPPWRHSNQSRTWPTGQSVPTC